MTTAAPEHIPGEEGWSPEIDYRFSLANERTYLAWIRTALALVAGGIAAAKALDFHHSYLRWIVAAPPIMAAAVLSWHARSRWGRYERDMRAGRQLPVGHRLRAITVVLAVYAILALVAVAIDR